MKIIKNKNPQITIVCCLHGDEVFGYKIFQYFKKHIKRYPNIQVILANVAALNKGKRFLDQDLNRSFPGKESGNHEQRLACQLIPLIKKSQYILDIHTTTSELKMTPIIAHLNKDVKTVLNICKSIEVVKMSKKLAKHALIGQIPCGVSLEFGEKYVKNPSAFKEAISIISSLLHKEKGKIRKRKVFMVNAIISNSIKIPLGVKNFQKLEKQNIYPFLLKEKSYTAHQGFAAKKYKYMIL